MQLYAGVIVAIANSINERKSGVSSKDINCF